MNLGPEGRQFRLLTVHCVLWSLAMSLANGFVGAYLLRLGFGIASTILLYALLLVVRFALRAVMLPIVRRLGMHRTMLLGGFIVAFQFLPLIWADQPLWLGAWIMIVSIGECLYWPIFHAATAVCGGGGRRGRQIAWRQMASTVISVAGPVAGGFLLTNLGPKSEFGIATILCIISTTPLLWMGQIDLGPVPNIRQSVICADRIGWYAFAADGWMCAGTGIAWSLILFTALGSSYGAPGMGQQRGGPGGCPGRRGVRHCDRPRPSACAVALRHARPADWRGVARPVMLRTLACLRRQCPRRRCQRPVCPGAHERHL
jgi:MFS transporter, DHA1 family, inner membrane transport protein